MAQMSRTALPSPANAELTRTNQLDVLAGVVPLERRDQSATLETVTGFSCAGPNRLHGMMIA